MKARIMHPLSITILAGLGLGACAGTAPNAVKEGFPAATLYHGALPLCQPGVDVGPCTTDALSGPGSDAAFPDGGFRNVVRDEIRRRREN